MKLVVLVLIEFIVCYSLPSQLLYGYDFDVFTEDHVGGIYGVELSDVGDDALQILGGYTPIGAGNVQYRFSLRNLTCLRVSDPVWDREFDLTTMRPGSRVNFAAVYVPSKRNIYRYGGAYTITGGWTNQLYSVDVDTGEEVLLFGSITNTNIEPDFDNGNPGSLTGSDLIYHIATNSLWLFGGETSVNGITGFSNNLWRMSLDSGSYTWEHVSGSRTLNPIPQNRGPGGLVDHTMTIVGDDIYVGFGYGMGIDHLQGFQNGLWTFNIVTEQWNQCSGSLNTNNRANYGVISSPGSASKLRVEPHADGLLFIGGYGYSDQGQGYLDDVWFYSLKTGQWVHIHGSKNVNSNRSSAGHGTVLIGNSLYVFGGKDSNGRIINYLIVIELPGQIVLPTQQPYISSEEVESQLDYSSITESIEETSIADSSSEVIGYQSDEIIVFEEGFDLNIPVVFVFIVFVILAIVPVLACRIVCR